MSGSHWNNIDQEVNLKVSPYDLPKILEALKKCFHEVDLALCGDSSMKDAEHELFNIVEKLGDDIFPH